MPHLRSSSASPSLVGFFAGVAWVTGNTMLGLEVPDEVRGRTFAFVGVADPARARPGAGRRAAGRGPDRHPRLRPRDANGEPYLVYNGAAFTFLIAAVLMTAVGVASYRQMDDRKGTSLLNDLRHAFTGSSGVYAPTGCFVALEGGEGAGKSTQARLLREWLEPSGYDVVLTHEPGDTEVGRKLRQIVLDPATGDDLAPHRGAALRRRQGRARRPRGVSRPRRGAPW